MAEQAKQADEATAVEPALNIAPGPHFGTTGRSTRWMMLDVIIALLPVMGMSLYVFGWPAARVLGVSVVACVATEAVFQFLRRRPTSVVDMSALVTGLILALSLPWTSPWWLIIVGAVVAIALGKMVFGGLGGNIFNPAMVGRAFLMICFTTEMTTWVMNSQGPANAIDAMTAATPLAAGKYEQIAIPLQYLFLGNVNGSLGETSALMCILGGLYLCLRRTAAWQIPVGVVVGAMAVAVSHWLAKPDAALGPGHHLFGGSLLFGAAFIATDPVSTPVSRKGRWIFGLGVGALTIAIRLFASYPEGVMFSILIMNALTPIINRYTIPAPVGGRILPKPGSA